MKTIFIDSKFDMKSNKIIFPAAVTNSNQHEGLANASLVPIYLMDELEMSLANLANLVFLLVKIVKKYISVIKYYKYLIKNINMNYIIINVICTHTHTHVINTH